MILKKKYWMLVIPLFLCVILFGYVSFSSLITSEYQFITSPKRTITLVIEYRVATLGESHYFYNFYQTFGPYGILMKKLDGKHFSLIHRSNEGAHPLELIRINHQNWVSENEVVLNSIDGEKVITLK